MFEITHNIQKSIIKKLTIQKFARYSEMRPPKIESNLYAYHLKTLIKNGYIKKNDNHYTLTGHGLNYVDRISSFSADLRIQPKITTRILLKNQNGEFLLTKRPKQPLIGLWGFISGKIHSSDGGVFASARREIREKIGCEIDNLRHIGDYYVKILEGGEVISDTFSHVFLVEISAERLSNLELGDSVWISKEKMRDLDLIPDTLDLVEVAEQGREKFFAELKYEISEQPLNS